MNRPEKRPIDAKDMPWSYIGKDALDAAAERAWEVIRPLRFRENRSEYPYHLASTADQETVQHAVLSVLGTTVPAMLRQRAKEIGKNGASVEERDGLYDLADELEAEHGT